MEIDEPRQHLQALIDATKGTDNEVDYKSVSLFVGRNETYIQQYFKKGSPRALPEEVRDRLSELFSVPADTFKLRTVTRRTDASKIDGVRFPDNPVIRPATNPVRNVPVRGTAAGGPQGAFQMTTGEPVDYVHRLPGIATARDVYALEVVGGSMAPRYEDGDLIYISPHKRPLRGDYVVVQMSDGDLQVTAYVKRFISMDDNWLHLEQITPPKRIKLPAAKVQAVHKILTTAELAR